jgi:transposase
MQERDGRSLPDAALEVLRERAVAMLEAGHSQIAVTLGVHKNTVCRWLAKRRVAGMAALKAKKRGRRSETQRLLDTRQAAAKPPRSRL